MWHGEKKNLHRPTFQHGTEFSSQNETSTTVTSQGRSEVKQQNQLCTDEIRSHDNSKKKRKKRYLFYTLSLLLQTGNQHATSLFCFPGDTSVELISNLTSLLFLLKREMYSSSPAMHISTSLSLGIFFY